VIPKTPLDFEIVRSPGLTGTHSQDLPRMLSSWSPVHFRSLFNSVSPSAKPGRSFEIVCSLYLRLPAFFSLSFEYRALTSDSPSTLSPLGLLDQPQWPSFSNLLFNPLRGCFFPRFRYHHGFHSFDPLSYKYSR